jgi:nitroreductase
MTSTNTLSLGKPAETHYPIHELFSERWSPRAFSTRPVEREKLQSLFEAARWAASAANKQPWTFLFATQEDAEAHALFAEGLNETNLIWAQHAPVLVLAVAQLYPYPGKEYVSFFDLGMATSNLLSQAVDLGLTTHPMGGFDPKKLRDSLKIPEGHEILAMIALGYPGTADSLPEALRERESLPRQRKTQQEFVFESSWPSVE